MDIKLYKFLLLIPILAGLLIIYWQFDPREWDFFPKCPFYHYTGLQCSGCGSQRAVHSLLHLDFGEAFKQNALIPLAIPYVLFGFFLDQKKQLRPRLLQWRNTLYGKKAIYLIAVIILSFTLIRNL